MKYLKENDSLADQYKDWDRNQKDISVDKNDGYISLYDSINDVIVEWSIDDILNEIDRIKSDGIVNGDDDYDENYDENNWLEGWFKYVNGNDTFIWLLDKDDNPLNDLSKYINSDYDQEKYGKYSK